MDFNTVVGWANIIAVPVAVIGVVVSIAVYLLQRQKPALICYYEKVHMLKGYPENGIFPNTNWDVNVLSGWGDRSLHVTQVKVVNCGNASIRSEDIRAPLTFWFESGTKIQGVHIAGVRPAPLRVVTESKEKQTYFERDTVEVKFDLLNPRDWFAIHLLCKGHFSSLSAKCHIAGISKVTISSMSERQRFWTKVALIGTWLVTLAFGVVAIINPELKQFSWLALLSLVAGAAILNFRT